MEQREHIDSAVLEEIAKVLKVPVEAIRNFSEDSVIFNIQNNSWHDNSANNNNYLCNINPIEKIIELYDALLKSEREKVALPERMLEKK